MYVFGAGMARFDTGAQPSWIESAAEAAFRVLSFPVFLIVEHENTLRFPGLWGYVPVLTNSALWAAVFIAFLTRRSGERIA
jgi:hypothetical protein